MEFSNAEGNTYWSRYLEAYHVIRDIFLGEYHKDVLKSLVCGSLVVGKVSLKNRKETFPGETVLVRIKLQKAEDTDEFQIQAEFIRQDNGTEIHIASVSQMVVNTEMESPDPVDVKKPYSMIHLPVAMHHIDALGAVHPLQIAHWVGAVREEFITRELPNVMQLMREGLIIITAQTEINYHKPAHFGDLLEARVRIQQVAKLKIVTLHIELVRSKDGREEVIAVVTQKLTYAELKKNGQVVATLVPTVFLKVSEKYDMSTARRTIAGWLAKFV
ncbi:MAG: acyl-CoA thioesterase [Patescibacteria group bacterium]